jgi:hypothetical protein
MSVPTTSKERGRLTRNACRMAHRRRLLSVRAANAAAVKARILSEGRTPEAAPVRPMSPFRERMRALHLVKQWRARRCYTRHDVWAHCAAAADTGLRRGWDMSLGHFAGSFDSEARAIADQVMAPATGGV